MAENPQQSQKVYGTYREQISQLRVEINRTVELGAATPELYGTHMTQLLKAVEGMRVKSEGEIHHLKEQIAYHQANQKSCGLFASLIISIIRSNNQQIIRGIKEDTKYLERLKDELKDLEEGSKPNPVVRGNLEKKIRQLEEDLESPTATVVPIDSKAERKVISEATARSIRDQRASEEIHSESNESSVEVNISAEDIIKSLKEKDDGGRTT